MITEQEFMKSFIPFKPMGDADTFEKEFMPHLEEIDLTVEEHRRNLLSSIWIFANSEWSRGYEQGKNNPDFND